MKTAVLLASLLALSVAANAQGALDGIRKSWSSPVEPFRVIGNVYYVGASGVSSHIVSTADGLILVDTGTTLMAPQIQENIETLGFDIRDVKFIVSSHAHWDHVESHAEIKRRSGAKIVALGDDAVAIESGTDNSALGSAGWEPAKVDRVIEDGDTLELGNTVMKAHWTPGHTKGCTTWTMRVEEGSETYTVVFVGGTSINQGVSLIGNTRHPSILEDYAKTFQTLKAIEADVFLAQHPSMYAMAEKARQLRENPARNPFVDTEGYRAFVAREEENYLRQVARERGDE